VHIFPSARRAVKESNGPIGADNAPRPFLIIWSVRCNPDHAAYSDHTISEES